MLSFATGNKHKFQEVSVILAEYEITIEQAEIDFVENPLNSLRQIAAEKAEQAFSKLRLPVIVEDTGVYFEAYKNFPGVQAKRIYESLGFDGLLNVLKGKSRKAYFHTILCFKDSAQENKFFEAKLHGRISSKVIKPNANVMPYEKIFIPEGSKKALSQISRKDKNQMSHRAVAARKFAEWFQDKGIDDFIESIE